MSIKKKFLTPSKFGLNTMKPLSSDQIVRTVMRKLDALDLKPVVREACKQIIKECEKGISSFPAPFEGLSGSDIGIITSDFGEVAGAVYMLNANKGFDKAKFPISEAERLVDYYLVQNNVDIKVSAKAGVGGAPSISAVEETLKNIDPNALSLKQKKALQVLNIIIKGTVYSSPLEAAEYLDLSGYKKLTQILKNKNLKSGYSNGIPKIENLSKAIESVGGFDACMKEFAPLFAAADFKLGGSAGETKMKSVFAGTSGTRYKKWGLMHFPITSEVMRWLNDDANGATEVLTIAAKTISVTQIYLDHTPKVTGTTKWKSGNLTFKTVVFSEARFKFHSPSSTPNPVGNRIGMKMIK
jgi:hypothetical protein